MELSDHLFRHESGRMVAALTRIFGIHNLALAEDVVQDAFCRAVEVWKFHGVPENPSGWLMATAKNRAIDVLRRERRARTFAPELGQLLESEWTLGPTVKELFEPAAIKDDELRMMFSCCNPRLPEISQIALVLHMLCGFSVSEVAGAFLNSESAVEKRLTRGKKILAASHTLFDLKDGDFLTRLSGVQKAIYLLFNEGFHGASAKTAVRDELCFEAMRLGRLLTVNPLTSTTTTLALSALMSLHAARIPARLDADGNLTSLSNQDRSKWDSNLLAEGLNLMDMAAVGTELSVYHVEAAIAATHGNARTLDETNWELIVSLYDTLMSIQPSPVVALNRAIAVAQHKGPQAGLAEIAHIADQDRLLNYPFYFAALAELELRSGSSSAAQCNFKIALQLARSPMERKFYEERIKASNNTGVNLE